MKGTEIPRLWERLNFLYPNPQCTTKGNIYESIRWHDQRGRKPNPAQLMAIPNDDLDYKKADEALDKRFHDPLIRAIAELLGQALGWDLDKTIDEIKKKARV